VRLREDKGGQGSIGDKKGLGLLCYLGLLGLPADDEGGAIGGDGLEEVSWVGGQVLMEDDLVVVVEEAQVHGAGMQVDATIELMWLVVVAPVMVSFGMGPGA
jgi:hypothetical protein